MLYAIVCWPVTDRWSDFTITKFDSAQDLMDAWTKPSAPLQRAAGALYLEIDSGNSWTAARGVIPVNWRSILQLPGSLELRATFDVTIHRSEVARA